MWITRQRQAHFGVSTSIMTEERARRLETLAGWSWDPAVTRWRRQHAALRAFLAANGGRYPSHKRPKSEEEKSLCHWIIWQRKRRRGKTQTNAGDKPSTLGEQEVAQLEALPQGRCKLCTIRQDRVVRASILSIN